MQKFFLLVLMSSIGVGLAINPVTNILNPNLLKAATWMVAGIAHKFLK
jgi:hypothetical protein